MKQVLMRLKVLIILNIVFLVACNDSAKQTNTPVVSSTNIPVFKSEAGDNFPNSISISLAEGATEKIEFTFYAEDGDGDPITWTISTLPVQGSVVISPDKIPGTTKTISYVPKENAREADTLVVSIVDGTGEGSKVIVNINFIPPSYKVSVSVSGYTTGNVLILQNNAGDDLSLTNDGIYQFSVPIDRGAPYDVTLATPTSVIKTSCQLTNAVGIMENTDVTGVTLTCVDTVPPDVLTTSPASDEIGVSPDTNVSVVFDEDMLAGSIGTDAVEILSTSLRVSGAVVKYNELDRILSLAFSPLEFNQTYTAVLSPNLSDLSGQLIDSSSWTFTTRDAAWGQAEKLMTIVPGITKNNSFVADDSGNGLFVWSEFNGTQGFVFAKKYDVNTGVWGAVKIVFTSTASAELIQAVSIASGNAVIVWDQLNGINHEVWFMYYDLVADVWSVAEKINTPNYVGKSHKLNKNLGAQGLVNWKSFDGVQKLNWASYFNWITKTWTAVKLDLPGSPEFLLNPTVAQKTLSEPIVLWKEGFSGQEVYKAINYDTGKRSWGDVELIVDAKNINIYGGAFIVTNSLGHGLVMWFEDDITELSMWIKRYDIDAKVWMDAEKIEIIKPKPSFIGGLNVALDSKGRGLLVMALRGQGLFPGVVDERVWTKRIEFLGNKIGSSQLIENGEGYASSPRVVINNLGEGIAVWQQHDGKRNNSWANRFDVNTSEWGVPQLLETINQGASQVPVVTISRTGRGLAVWRQVDDDGNHIWTNQLK